MFYFSNKLSKVNEIKENEKGNSDFSFIFYTYKCFFFKKEK